MLIFWSLSKSCGALLYIFHCVNKHIIIYDCSVLSFFFFFQHWSVSLRALQKRQVLSCRDLPAATVGFSWWAVPFIINFSFFALVIFFALKSTLSHIYILATISLVLARCRFFFLWFLTCVFILHFILCRQHLVRSGL